MTLNRTKRPQLTKAQENNLVAAKVIRGMLSRSFGPRGLAKLTVNNYGDSFLIQAGVDILEKIDFKHPVAKMMLDLSKSLESSIGDGSITAVLLATGLVEKAGELMRMGVHPTVIVEGYQESLKKCLSTLGDLSFTLDPNDSKGIRRVAYTSLLTKVPQDESDLLSGLVVQALKTLKVEETSGLSQDLTDHVNVIAREGDFVKSSLVDGVAFDSTVLDPSMPKRVIGARIAIVQSLFGIREMKMKTEIGISDVASLPLFRRKEKSIIYQMISDVVSSGANVLFTHKGVDDLAFALLSASRIFTVRRVGMRDLRRIEQSTGAKMILSTDEGFEGKIGHSVRVEEKEIGDRKWIIVQDGEKHGAVTILVRGYLQRSADHLQDTLKRVVRMVGDTLRNPDVVAGGGACEMSLSRELHVWSISQTSRKQLAVEMYSKVLESIPTTLAINSGMNQLDVIPKLRRHHAEGQSGYGIDSLKGELADAARRGYIESTHMKSQILNSATEAAVSIIRIGDVYQMSHQKSEKTQKEGPDYP